MRVVLILTVGAALAAAGCGATRTAKGTTSVVAAFYPLAWAAERIGGSTVDVRNLTPSGAEPHDVELTPKEVGAVQRADVVFYFSHDFQPAVADAVRGAHGRAVDVLSGTTLYTGAGDESGRTDPHVWLDPVRFAAIVTRMGETLGRPRAGRLLAARLRALDRSYRTGLRRCIRRDFVSSHAAFAYLASRYGLRMIAITGVDPESEPSARKLGELAAIVRREQIPTVFFERLASPRLAETIAREADVRTAVLDPIEGLTPGEARRGVDYLALMRQNLRALRRALGCS